MGDLEEAAGFWLQTGSYQITAIWGVNQNSNRSKRDPVSVSRGPSRLPLTGCVLQGREADCSLLSFTPLEGSLQGLARGRLPGAGLRPGLVLGFWSLGSGAASSRRWWEERPLPPSWACALERRLAARRAMPLVPSAISWRAEALSSGLAAGCSMQTKFFLFSRAGLCRGSQRLHQYRARGGAMTRTGTRKGV